MLGWRHLVGVTDYFGGTYVSHRQTEAVAMDCLLKIANPRIKGAAKVVENGALENLGQAAAEVATDAAERKAEVHALAKQCVEARSHRVTAAHQIGLEGGEELGNFEAKPTVKESRLVRDWTARPFAGDDERIVVGKNGAKLRDDVKDGDACHFDHLRDMMESIFTGNALKMKRIKLAITLPERTSAKLRPCSERGGEEAAQKMIKILTDADLSFAYLDSVKWVY